MEAIDVVVLSILHLMALTVVPYGNHEATLYIHMSFRSRNFPIRVFFFTISLFRRAGIQNLYTCALPEYGFLFSSPGFSMLRLQQQPPSVSPYRYIPLAFIYLYIYTLLAIYMQSWRSRCGVHSEGKEKCPRRQSYLYTYAAVRFLTLELS